MAKLTHELERRLSGCRDDEFVEVVVELEAAAEGGLESVAQPTSRAGKIAARKEAFARHAGPLTRAVRELGGEVTGEAWINNTLRVRIRAGAVTELGAKSQIAALDLPRQIKSDA